MRLKNTQITNKNSNSKDNMVLIRITSYLKLKR